MIAHFGVFQNRGGKLDRPALRAGLFFHRRRGKQFRRAAPALIFAFLAGCAPSDAKYFQGYIEGEFVYIASPLAGRLTRLEVKRGNPVAKDALLFQLDQAVELERKKEAAKRLAQAKSRLRDLQKGKRPSEIAALKAKLEQAEISLQLSETELKRQKTLFEKNVISEEDYDRARTEQELNRARIEELKAELETARLGARPDELKASEAEIGALSAVLAKAEWDLGEKTQRAPAAAIVFDTLFRTGEWVPAGRPVVSLLPSANIRVRFWAPEEKLAGIQLGSRVTVSIDGTERKYSASVNYISPQSEFTPPVIYSRETRSKLVYMVEASFPPEVAATLHPGQPVEVIPAPVR